MTVAGPHYSSANLSVSNLMAMALSPADNSKPLSVSYMTVGLLFNNLIAFSRQSILVTL